METKRRSAKWIIAATGFAALALIVLCGLVFLFAARREQIRAQSVPPVVFVSEPAPGTAIPEGSLVSVSATAMGPGPIARAELWMDGELVETQDSEVAGGISPFYAHFSVLVPEGPHILVARAVNSAGFTGQSVPVGIIGSPEQEQGPAFVAVTVEDGQSLEDIASSYSTEPLTLRYLNPDLNGQQPASGAQIVVPAPPPQTPPGPRPSPTVSGVTPSAIAPPPAATSSPTTAPVVPGGSTPGTVAGGSGPGSAPIPPPLKIITPAPLPGSFGFLKAFPVFLLPAAPTNLKATVTNCTIRLQWNDNTGDELRYEVWLTGPSLNTRRVAVLNPAPGGTAWVEFPAPRAGDFSVWVEAVNIVGSQPSNIVSVKVPSVCPDTLPEQLLVELLDMKSQGSEDKVYCYVSFDKAPEVRIPAGSSAFIQIQAGQADLAKQEKAGYKLMVPIPRDGTLEVGGECWGWSGQTLNKLGDFSGMTSAAEWTGGRLVLTGDSYQIGYAVKKTGTGGELTTYGYEDPTLPSPYGLQVISVKPMIPNAATTTKLTWDWSGKETLTGFVVHLDGKPYKTISNPKARAAQIFMPACGTKYRWQVAAVAGEANSRLSAEYVSTTAECPVYVDVEFVSIQFKCVENYWFYWTCPNCGDVDAWFDLWVNDQWAGSGTENFTIGITCGTYDMWKLYYWGDPKRAKVRIKLAGPDPTLTVRSRFYYINHWGEQTTFQNASKPISMPLEKWRTYKAEFPMEVKSNGVWSKLNVKVEAVPSGSIL